MAGDPLMESDGHGLNRWYTTEVVPLIRPATLSSAIERLRFRLADEARLEARLFLLSELALVFGLAGRDEEGAFGIDAAIAAAPDDPFVWSRLASWHFYEHGFYDADAERLEAALDAIDQAISRARVGGAWLRHFLNDRARIVVAMKRWDLLRETMEAILAIAPGRDVPDTRLEDDFLRRMPEDAIGAELLSRYRSALAEQATRRPAS